MFPPVAWSVRCRRVLGGASDGLTRERLLADSAALLKEKFTDAALQCGEEIGAALGRKLTSLAPGAIAPAPSR